MESTIDDATEPPVTRTTSATTTMENPANDSAKDDQDAAVTADDEDNPVVPAKRQKALTIFRDESSFEASFRSDRLDATPFPHLLVANLFDHDFLQAVIREIKDNSTVNFKESDLFRVFQSIDFANLRDDDDDDDDNNATTTKLPHVWDLRTVLYSREWRRRIETAFGLTRDTLTDQIDCACNCHAEGCHLLCHDDVIGTRCISYILYLTEPDWPVSAGGSLELFGRVEEQPKTGDDDDDAGHGQQFVPSAIPIKYILPTLNQLVCFQVEPTVSFHAVQEVRGDRPRLSLQGWYHTKEPPDNKELATLQRLKDKGEMEAGFPFRAMNCAVASQEENEVHKESSGLDAKDMQVLSAFIQDTYLNDSAIKEIAEKFESDSSVQLRNFLKDDIVKRLNLDDNDDKDLVLNTPEFDSMGVSDQWKLVGPPHKQRFLELTSAGDAASPLSTIRSGLMEHPAFGRYLHFLTGLQAPTSFRGRTRRFRRGRDYTVAHYGQLLKNESVLDATFCFVKDDEEFEQELWESGNVGGFECYIEADDEEGSTAPADEYNEDDDTELLSVSASNNTLSLVYRDPGTMRFIKYIGSQAPSSRWDIAMEYQVPQDEENKAAGEGGEDEETEAEEDEASPEAYYETDSAEEPANKGVEDADDGELLEDNNSVDEDETQDE